MTLRKLKPTETYSRLRPRSVFKVIHGFWDVFGLGQAATRTPPAPGQLGIWIGLPKESNPGGQLPAAASLSPMSSLLIQLLHNLDLVSSSAAARRTISTAF